MKHQWDEGFLDKEDWYQRRLFADHLRSVEVVRTFTEINQTKSFFVVVPKGWRSVNGE